jgi:hypothetical protein
MGCGCKERRSITANMITAMKNGDFAALNQHTHEMATSLGHDLSNLRLHRDLMPRQLVRPPPRDA